MGAIGIDEATSPWSSRFGKSTPNVDHCVVRLMLKALRKGHIILAICARPVALTSTPVAQGTSEALSSAVNKSATRTSTFSSPH